MRLPLTKYVIIVLTILIVPLTIFPSGLLLLVPLTVSTVNSFTFYFYRVIEKPLFLLLQEFVFHNPTSSITVTRCSTPSASSTHTRWTGGLGRSMSRGEGSGEASPSVVYYEETNRDLTWKILIYECRCNEWKWGLVVYYEETKREWKRILIYECRCNERLKR